MKNSNSNKRESPVILTIFISSILTLVASIILVIITSIANRKNEESKSRDAFISEFYKIKAQKLEKHGRY